METNTYFLDIAEAPIRVEDALTFVADPAHGAVSTFVGTIRNHNADKTVTAVSYDVSVPLARNVLKQLCEEAHRQWGDSMKIFVCHSKSKVEVGGISVVIAVSAPHRRESLNACQYLIDETKHRCPIWKKEFYTDGESNWVEGHALCS